MKKALLLILAITLYNTVFSQIINPGFEAARDTMPSMPKSWNTKKVEGFTLNLDTALKYSGRQSLCIEGAQTVAQGTFMPFSQIVTINVNNMKQVSLICYAKTQSVKGNVQLWCQVWDKNNKMIGFQNSQMQNTMLTGTNDWKKLQLTLLVDTNAKRLLIGGFLLGSGSAWFDSFSIDDLPPPSVKATKEVTNLANEIINLVKQNSIYKDSIAWPEVDKHIAELVRFTPSVDDAGLLTEYILSQLRKAGDNHSFYQNKTSAQQYTTGNSVPEQPYGKLLEGNIGYIFVPAFASINDTASVNFAKKIQHFIRDLDTRQKIKGWIVDLRKDGGGNMYPMIAGLGAIINEGVLGYFVSPGSQPSTSTAWFYRNGSSGINENKYVTVKKPYKIKNAKAKVAVLIGANTASSGEMTAISFIGRQNTQLFGQPSGGFTTANQMFTLSNGAFLNLATSYVADRNKKRYLVNIRPDIIVKPDDNVTIDATLNTALSWVKQ
ncbi:S41 family peptidase [Mucilaginibacter limnophilus]|nr:S41 family peptidase [Mucilaginibacter limnophilus]